MRKSNLQADRTELYKVLLVSVRLVTVVYGDRRLTGS